MERLLKDYLVECTDEKGMYYSLTCTVCGGTWMSRKRDVNQKEMDRGREEAAKEAAEHNHVCHFCGRPVCKECYVEMESINLCLQCGNKLKDKLKSRE